MSEHVFFIAFFTLRLLFWDLVVRLCQTEEANHKQQKENQYENWMQKIRKCQPYWTKSATEQIKRNVHVRGRQHGANGARNVNVRLISKRLNSPPFKSETNKPNQRTLYYFPRHPRKKMLKYYLQSNNLQKENQRI